MKLKEFTQSLKQLAAQLQRTIEAEVMGFANDPAAIAERRARVFDPVGGFEFFVQTYFPHYVRSPHKSQLHEYLFFRLPEILNSPKNEQDGIAAPRGEAKSTLVTQLFTLWCIVTHRKHYILLVMDSIDQAYPMLEAIKAELEFNPRLAMDFADVCGQGRVWQAGAGVTANDIKVQVAGSGKTLILLMRCQYLAEQSDKPVLVLCYNRVLADKLRTAVADKGLAEKVEVCSFHQWCGKLQKAYGLDTPERYRHLPGYEHAPLTVLQAMHDGTLPGGRYGAVLIDEGHDFEADWLRLSVHMLDADNGHLLLLYDDAQAIYKKSGAGLGFTLSSVGIKAQGRTTILRLNYRNTKEIIGFAYLFAQNKMQPHESGEDGVPLVEPEAAGVNGISPYIKECSDWQGELDYLARCLDKWLKDRIPPQDLAVICYNKEQCNDVAKLLKQKGIRHSLHYGGSKKAYNPHDNAVAVFTMHSSKGLEFQRVMLMGICTLKHKDANQEADNTRLLYVAMTRAQNYLMITLSGSGLYQSRLLDSYRQFKQLNGNNAD